MSDDRLVLAFPESLDAARRFAARASLPVSSVELHRFPDGESLVRVPAKLPAEVVVFRSMDRPNGKLVELMFAAAACRERGVRVLTLVAPYLCYMRQDKAFRPGEAVSQRVVGRFLGELFESVITVDPHLHRIDTLAEVIPGADAFTVSAANPIGRFLASRAADFMLVGPDEESGQWVRRIAEVAGVPFAVARKVRSGDRQVSVRLPADHDFHGVSAVLVDDVASTGHTLAAAARQLHERGAVRVDCVVTHALFCEGALATMHDGGIGAVWSADSIVHPSNAIHLDDVLAGALRGR